MTFLFSYGTLQEGETQLATFGRRLASRPDALPRFERVALVLDDPKLIASSGRAQHANARFTGEDASRVEGSVLEVTDDELAKADVYERLANYKRIRVRLASGCEAWVYVYAPTAP